MIKKRLAAPGPTPIPAEVMTALAQPIMYHRGPAFTELMGNVRAGLQRVFQTSGEVMILTASGTGAMEAAIANLTQPGQKVITVEAGKFGERWGEIAKAYNLNVIQDRYEYGESAQVERVKNLLDEHPDVRLVCIQASETSTGVVHPVREIAEIIRRKPETLLVVDAITGVGVFDLPMDTWGIDVLISGSQKAFMLPPGLSFIALNEKAWHVAGHAKQPRYYFDLLATKKSQEKNQNAFTPGINLIQGLKVALEMIDKETLPKVFERHEKGARATRAAVKALGLSLFPRGNFAPGVTAVKAPEGISGDQIVKAFRDQHGITIAGGQGSMKGPIFRLSHMGCFDHFDIVGLIAILETVLINLGYKKFEPGAGMTAAQREFLS